MWMNQEIIILTEESRQKQISYDIIVVIQFKIILLTEESRQRQISYDITYSCHPI